MSTAALLALSLLAPLASADSGKDTLIHKDGRIFDGVSISVEEDTVLVAFEHGNVSVSREDVLELVLADGESFIPRTDDERARVAKGQVQYKGKWMTVASRDKRRAKDLAEMREEVEARKAGRLWRNREIVETKNFIFESTAPPHVTEYYRNLSEAYFQEFAKTWKIKRGKAGKLKVKFFVDQDDYRQVTGMSAYVTAFFRFIEPYELCVYYNRLDPAATEEVLFHELGHYLQKLIDVDFKYPHWPGESLSEYYGASSWDPVKKKVEVGKVLAGRLQEVRSDIAMDEWVTLEELLTGAPNRTYHDYTWGWTLVHYLMSEKRYAKNFNKFYIALAKDKNVDRFPMNYGRTTLMAVTGDTMEATFRKFMKLRSDEDFEQLQAEWYDYIEEGLSNTSTRGLEIAAFNNLRFDRRLRAKRLFEEAIAQGSDNAQTFYLYGDLLEDLDEYDEARTNFEIAIEHDGLVPQYYISLGRLLVSRGPQEDYDFGESCLRLAQDIEPDNFYLERNLERLLRDGRKRLNKGKSKSKSKSKKKSEDDEYEPDEDS